MEDEISYGGYKFQSVLRLGFPGLVVFGILPTSVEFIDLIVSLGLNLQSQNAIVRQFD